MNSKLTPAILFTTLALLLSACSMEASIKSLEDGIKTLQAPGQPAGITSGSSQAQLTTDGSNGTHPYRVSTSVGVLGANNLTTKGMYHNTGTYKVYSSLQGALVSPQ